MIGQSRMLVPSIGPCSERMRNSQSLNRGQQPAQCTDVPPTVLHVHAGRLGKSLATRHDPEVVRSTAVVEVYSDTATWRRLGYEGPSFAQGGYLHRGFDDLDWLPDLPQES